MPFVVASSVACMTGATVLATAAAMIAPHAAWAQPATRQAAAEAGGAGFPVAPLRPEPLPPLRYLPPASGSGSASAPGTPVPATAAPATAAPAQGRSRRTSSPLPLPLPPPSTAGNGGPRFLLRDVVLTGTTALNGDELRAVARPYLGRVVGAAELEDLRRSLTDVYRRRGYVNSGFVMPDQRVDGGVVTMRAVEGRLTEITVRGGDRSAPSPAPAYVAERLRRGVGTPLSIADLRESIEILLQDPVIDRLDARLSPGAAPGEGALDVAATGKPPVQTTFTLSNGRSPSVGGYEGRGEAALRNLTGYGDATTLRYARARGLTDLSASVELPLAPSDLRLRLSAESTRSRVVEEPFSVLDVQTQTATYEIGLTRPVWRTAAQNLTLGAALVRREAIYRLMGERYDFTSETEDGIGAATMLRLTQTWTDRGVVHAFAARSTVSVGVDALGATVGTGTADGRFVVWLGQAQYARRLDDDGSQLLLRADVQAANDPLPGIEQYALGGMATVRGYRENLLARDNAVVASVELRRPLFVAAPGDWISPAAGGSVAGGSAAGGPAAGGPVASGPGGTPAGTVQGAVFVDWGRGFNTGRRTPSPGWIASVGVGALWRVSDRIEAQAYYGRALREVDDGRDDALSDDGVHFRIVFTP